jgi:hypothetical protein
MNVIGHQTPSQDATLMVKRMVTEYLQVSDPVLIREENILSIVPALGNVVSDPGNDEARAASHIWIVDRDGGQSLKKCRLSPFPPFPPGLGLDRRRRHTGGCSRAE